MQYNNHSKLGFMAMVAWVIGCYSLVVGQQGVAPPAAGYGNRTATPTNRQPANPQTGDVPGGVTAGQAVNPALNPALNQRSVSNQLPGAGTGKEVVTKNPWSDNPPSPQEIAHLEQVLGYWEKSTANIERYSSKFLRWQYNSSDNFVGELAAKTGKDIRSIPVSTAIGELKYMTPDKGMFKIDRLVKLSGQLDAKGQPEYKDFENVFGEWWLCDGEKVYEYDRSSKKCTRFTMPPEMRGEGVLESPMPFMFGVKAEKIKARYWVRSLPPPKDQQGKQRDDIFVIEAYPKFQSDAVNYDHVQIYLDRQMFLPMMLYKYNTEHVDQQGQVLNDNREAFEFSDRLSEAKNLPLLKKIGEMFHKSFIPFDVPNNWTVEDKIFDPPATENIRAAAIPGPPQPNDALNIRK